MTINWKKSAIVVIDIALAVYLLLAVTAFNKPDGQEAVCTQVDIEIEDGVVDGFLGDHEIWEQLQKANISPQGKLMSQIDIRKMEEVLQGNPFVEKAECYKTPSGHIHILLTQRLPVVRVKAINGDDYYIDSHGDTMPATRYTSDLVVATGHINEKYAKKVLGRIGNFLLTNTFWHHQIEQLNILADGSIEMVPRVGDHIVFLGRPSYIQQKLNRLEKFYLYGLSEAGWNKYSYISLEFNNQIICKKRRNKII